jgi:hypothetical protein
MYKRIDFSKLEGLATYQDTLDFLQVSYREAISAIAKAFGSKVIITGVTDQGTTFSDGWVVIDGELMPFAGGLKTDRIVVEELSDTEIFSDGSIQTVYYTKRAKLGITGGFAFTDFIRVDTMSAISTGLKNLVTAHNNLQAAFNTHTHSWNDITNKPATFPPSYHRTNWTDIDNVPQFLRVLWKEERYIGDSWTDSQFPIGFPDLGTSNYFVVGSLLSVGGDFNQDNDVVWTIRDKRSNSFTLLTHEIGDPTQDLRFDYAIIPF